MQKDKKEYIKDDLTYGNVIQNFESIPFKIKGNISDENQILNDFFPKNDIQVFKPIPIESIKQPSDKNFLCKKRSEYKGLHVYNNLYKNFGGNNNNCVFHSFLYNNNIKYQKNPLIIPDLININ
jgi:hypothetical protein